jgi:hypothetical protein
MSAAMKPAAKPVPPQPPPRQPRLTLASVKKGKLELPPRIYLYGVEGIGKSTLAAAAPSPIFLGAEDGTGQLDVQRFPQPHTLADAYDAVRELATGTHEYRTLVIDTVDWLEPLLWSFICERDGKANIEAYGYGKGYQAALDEWRLFIREVERMRGAKSMGVIVLGHAQIKLFKNPEGEDFDRYSPKMNEKAAGLWKEWADAVLFANYETFAVKAKRDADNVNAKAKGVSSNARLLFTERSAAFDAKNRYGLPPTIPLDWGALAEAMKAGAPAPPEELLALITEALPRLVDVEQEKVRAAIGRAGNDPLKLSQLHNYVQSKSGPAPQKEA